MLANSQADGLVFGAGTPASDALLSLFRTIPLRENVKTASSVLILDLEEKHEFGIDGGLFLSDCAVLPDPNEEQLADMVISSATLANHLTGEVPRVALLSYSTHTEKSSDPSVTKMAIATKLAREKARTLDFPIRIDGEIQADVALDKYAAKQKGIEGEVAGQANVLIFPNLHSSNIAAKMITILAGGYGYGQIMTGLSKPAAQVSRGASAHDIFATAVIVGAQATDREYLLT
jgi:phosphate acetyltransferase